MPAVSASPECLPCSCRRMPRRPPLQLEPIDQRAGHTSLLCRVPLALSERRRVSQRQPPPSLAAAAPSQRTLRRQTTTRRRRRRLGLESAEPAGRAWSGGRWAGAPTESLALPLSRLPQLVLSRLPQLVQSRLPQLVLSRLARLVLSRLAQLLLAALRLMWELRRCCVQSLSWTGWA
jgi:hypothetical protein